MGRRLLACSGLGEAVASARAPGRVWAPLTAILLGLVVLLGWLVSTVPGGMLFGWALALSLLVLQVGPGASPARALGQGRTRPGLGPELLACSASSLSGSAGSSGLDMPALKTPAAWHRLALFGSSGQLVLLGSWHRPARARGRSLGDGLLGEATSRQLQHDQRSARSMCARSRTGWAWLGDKVPGGGTPARVRSGTGV
ncbi:hypothetical protein AADG42_05590 [Ammonicoccus fulvus]|uniref:Uncharacterized protein n=1 Tax=Ammonicoccus fulvus TaxID=3138240 RepID=A0ABZ3FNW4_9ACTN